MSDLRKKLIRLANAKPEFRKDLLPLLKSAGDSRYVAVLFFSKDPYMPEKKLLSSQEVKNVKDGKRWVEVEIKKIIGREKFYKELLRMNALEWDWVELMGPAANQLYPEYEVVATDKIEFGSRTIRKGDKARILWFGGVYDLENPMVQKMAGFFGLDDFV